MESQKNNSKGQSITQMPSAAYPLLNGNTAKSSSDQKGCCAKNKKAIIFIVSMAVVLVIAGAVAAILLIPISASSSSGSSISQSRSKLNTSFWRNETSDEYITDYNSTYSGSRVNPLEAFAGNWIIDSQENLDEFLKAIGLGWIERMFAPTIKTKMNIIVHGPGAITVEMTTISTKIVEIQFNKDNEYVTVDGRTVVAFHSLEGNRWIIKERWNAGNEEKLAKYDHEIIDDEIIIHIYVDDVICMQRYVRIEQ